MRARLPHREPEPPTRTEPRPQSLSVATLAALQRSAGNQAVTRAVQERRSLQRNKDSWRRMGELVTPKVFPGPEIDVQDLIASALDKQIGAIADEKVRNQHGISCLGGIKLKSAAEEDMRTLIKRSELRPMAKGKTKVEPSSFAMAENAGVTGLIVLNTLRTMEAAGQLAYLRESGMLDEGWAVVVEVHYYHARPTSATRFHKDTEGQTLFVNLNYQNDEPMAGPEWIVNPHVPQEQADRRAQTLPKPFLRDLADATAGMHEGGVAGTESIPPRGVVSFVDEAVHHKTPTMRHRTATDVTVKAALETKFKLAPGSLEKQFEAYNERGAKSRPFSSYLTGIETKDAEQIHKILEHLSTRRYLAQYNRHQLAEFIPNGFLDIDRLVAADHPDLDFATASVPYMPQTERNVPLQSPGRPPLKREMSGRLDQPGSVESRVKREQDARPKGTDPAPRKFFRTWVRVVRREELDSYFET